MNHPHIRRLHARDDSTGAVDRDRASRGTKMDREMRNTDARTIPDRDLRGIGRQMIAQQEREKDFDRMSRELSAAASRRSS
jgi:hypothetical protein